MSRIIQYTTHSEEDTMSLAASLAARLKGGELILLDGPLGAGKTRFVRGLASGLGIEPSEVSSPTFILVQEYGANSATHLIHVDTYRLRGPEELDTIGWSELLERLDRRNAVLVIEWPSRIQHELDPQREHIAITFEHLGPESRRIEITATDAFANRLEHLRDEATEII